MADTNVSNGSAAVQKASWLLLIADLPAKPDYLRVKLRRRVQRLGAVAIKGAVYLLPNAPDRLADFRSLRREIAQDGGDASLCEAHFVDGFTDQELIDRFNVDRDEEYGGFVASCDLLTARWAKVEPAARAALIAQRGRLFSRLEGILGRDSFGSPQREEAMQALERLAVLDILPPR